MFTESQFETLMNRYMDMIYRLAFSHLKCRADADDVTQTVLVSLYRTDTAFESEAHIRHWIVRVTLNECRKIWRSPWSKQEDITEYANTISREEPQYEDLFLAIMRLERKYRILIVLHYYEGYSIAELADMLHLPVGTVGTRLARARNKLKTHLTEVY